MITNDLEFLISKAVDTSKADYAVITGVQIHNWGSDKTGAPTLEFIAPTTGYVVIDGKRVDLELQKVRSGSLYLCLRLCLRALRARADLSELARTRGS